MFGLGGKNNRTTVPGPKSVSIPVTQMQKTAVPNSNYYGFQRELTETKNAVLEAIERVDKCSCLDSLKNCPTYPQKRSTGGTCAR